MVNKLILAISLLAFYYTNTEGQVPNSNPFKDSNEFFIRQSMKSFESVCWSMDKSINLSYDSDMINNDTILLLKLSQLIMDSSRICLRKKLHKYHIKHFKKVFQLFECNSYYELNSKDYSFNISMIQKADSIVAMTFKLKKTIDCPSMDYFSPKFPDGYYLNNYILPYLNSFIWFDTPFNFIESQEFYVGW